MRANPGGEIAPSEVVGRDRLIQRIWQTLEQQSVILVSERRMGKSCVNKKMAAERPEGTITVYRDVESIDSPIGFARRVCHDVMEHLSGLRKTAGRIGAFLEHLGGVEIGGVLKLPEAAAPHWKGLLEKTLEDLGDSALR